MGPEFRRNVWLELTPRRMVLAAILLGLAFFAAALSGGSSARPAAVAGFLYYVLVVVWGARNAALGVAGEIRERTWDWQRLSALTAGEMMWGKLFGSTIFNWFAGGICLAAVLVHAAVQEGPLGALIDLVYFLAIGVIAQAVALLASLVAVRRRQPHTRGEIFLYQLAGILAAFAVFWVWDAADPAGPLLAAPSHAEWIVWWGQAVGARPFLLVSLALFAGWTLVACHRAMRLELKMRNGPLVWLGFLVFVALYVAGFDAWLSPEHATAGWDAAALRLGLAASAFAALTYAMVLLEPKDRVHFRWLGSQIGSGRIGAALWNLDGFLMSYIAAILFTGGLMGWLWTHEPVPLPNIALIGAGFGFLTRDVALFLLFNAALGRQRGDFTAVVVLFALYALIPSVLDGLGMTGALAFFYPRPMAAVWVAPAVAWGEALAAIAAALMRIALGERPAPEAV